MIVWFMEFFLFVKFTENIGLPVIQCFENLDTGDHVYCRQCPLIYRSIQWSTLGGQSVDTRSIVGRQSVETQSIQQSIVPTVAHNCHIKYKLLTSNTNCSHQIQITHIKYKLLTSKTRLNGQRSENENYVQFSLGLDPTAIFFLHMVLSRDVLQQLRKKCGQLQLLQQLRER